MIPVADIVLVLWLGILASISPCSLATNTATIAFLGRQIGRRGMAVVSGIAYALGRVTAYMILGCWIVSASQAVSGVALFLQKHMTRILGPTMILVGLLLLNILRFPGRGAVIHHKVQTFLGRKGWIGAYALGILFALAFCPVSAALFFGSTATLAIKHQSRIVMPGLFGIGTALPVLVLAFLVTYGMHALGRMFSKIHAIEAWARFISGCIFILVGFYHLLAPLL